MNRKERLRVFRTPDKSLIHDETLYFPSPEKNKEIDYNTDLPKRIKKPTIWERALSYLSHIHFFLLYATILYMHFSKPKDVRIDNLMREITTLKQENISLRNKQDFINLARVEHNTEVIADPNDLYKYGFYGFRTYKDPNVILNDNLTPGDCMSLNGVHKKFFIKFDSPKRVRRVGLVYPVSGKNLSFVKRFQILGYVDNDYLILGDFVYDITKSKYQVFDLKEVTTNMIVFCVFSNHGCKEYTSIYKVYLYGNEK